jgi:hypothetical protein
VPELTVPQTDQEPTATEPGTDTQTETEAEPPATETTPPSDDGGTTAPEETMPDAPENDTPPPEDSPAERFEDFCNENPGACG